MKFPDLTLPVLHFNDPLLEFGSRQTTAHPKDGLFLYGPFNKPKKTCEATIGVIGTPAGINHFHSWAARAKKLVSVPPPGKSDKKNRLHLADFRGWKKPSRCRLTTPTLLPIPSNREPSIPRRGFSICTKLSAAAVQVLRLSNRKPAPKRDNRSRYK